MDDSDNSTNDIEEVVVQEVSSSTDYYSDIVGAILTIPATLIVLSFFVVVYKLFVNRRTRG